MTQRALVQQFTARDSAHGSLFGGAPTATAVSAYIDRLDHKRAYQGFPRSNDCFPVPDGRLVGVDDHPEGCASSHC